MMRLRIPLKMAAVLTVLLLNWTSHPVSGQSSCPRCSSPANQPANLFGTWPDFVRYRPDPIRMENPALPLPATYDATQRTNSNANDNPRKTPSRPSPVLIPTDSVTPSVTEEQAPKKSKTPGTPSVTDRIGYRYSDPRVIRMLSQLTPSGVEAVYAEVSELIDVRHINPPAYSRRVDNALDQLILALDVPAYTTAAQVKGSAQEIENVKNELRDLRSELRVRNRNDALAALRKTQLLLVDSINVNPAAIGLEFVYGSTDSLDQFSMLLPPEKNGGPSVGLRDNVVGIGVEVESHPAGLKVLKLLPGGPAAQADLRRGDLITQVDGHDLKQMELNQAVDFIVGPVGTPVQIQASRAGRSGRVTLTRQRIALHTVVDVRMEDPAQGIGYLKLEQFNDSALGEMDTALAKLHQQGMKSLIIDLRGNPGGLLTTAIELSDRFLPAGTIVSTRGRTQADNSREMAHFANTWNVPLVVLIDHNSASASEIFAAAIQENGRGLIVGEKSYGKGTVQTLFPLDSFPAALRLTTAKFYSPQGREMAGAGVTPDVKVANESKESGQDDLVLGEAVKRIVDPRVKEMPNHFYRKTSESPEESHVAT